MAGGEHEIVADGRMDIGVIVRGQRILLGQTVEVWHGRAADHAGVAVVFLDQKEDMPNLQVGDGNRSSG